MPPAARGSSPESGPSSSCWPLPETPATPTISPARTARPMPLRLTPKGRAAARRAAHAQHLGAWRAVAGAQAGGFGPVIRRARLALVSCVGSTSPTTARRAAPCSGGTGCRISFSFVRDVEDGAALAGELAQRDEELLDGLRRQHRGGLVEDQELGWVSSARTISTRWRSPTLSVCTGRIGSTGRP